jgi:hypothetical protein
MRDEIQLSADCAANHLRSLAKLVADAGEHATAIKLQGFAGYVQAIGLGGEAINCGPAAERS